MLKKGWLILLCCLLNSGCSLLGPTYTKPRVNIPKAWPHKYHFNHSKAANLPELVWWKQFDSPELNELIHIALQQNADAQVALANIQYARSELDQIKLSWLPNLTALAGFSQFPIFANPGTFAIAYPLYVINILQLYKQQQSAKAILAANVYAYECARLVVIAQTSASFFTLIAQKEALKIYKKLLQDYGSYLSLAQSQYRHGLVPYDKIDLLISQMNQIQSQIDVTKHNIIVSKNALRYLLNDNPGNIKTKTSFKHLNSNGLIPSNLPVSVLNARPDIRQAESLLKAAHADVGAVTANLFPTITLGAYLGKGSSIKGPINLFEAYLSGPIIDLPIFAQISASKAQYKAVCIKYIDTIRKALQEVSNDLSAYSAYTKQLENNQLALLAEKRHCRLVKSRYHHGLEDINKVVQCKIKVDQFELRINQNKLEKMIALVTLYQSLGGGYHGV